MNFQEWVETYKPVNIIEPVGWGIDVINSTEEKYIWTLLECEGYHIISGAHWVNRITYIICAIPYDDGDWIDITNDECNALYELELEQ